MSEEQIKAIMDILKRGNEAEVKKVYGKIVIVEIKRTVKYKSPA